MLQYMAPSWESSLRNAGITDFTSAWNEPLEMVDEINHRRGGMSSVGKLIVTSPTGNTITLFIKRQRHHQCRRVSKPWTKIPTLRREYQNLIALHQQSISTGMPIFYAEQGSQAVLGILEIKDATDLLQYYQQHADSLSVIVTRVATEIAKLHRLKWQHTALYPKHIFINSETQQISFIDMESARKRLSWRRIMMRDLDSLNRHMPGLSALQRARFLKVYLGSLNRKKSFTTIFRKLWKKYQLKIR